MASAVTTGPASPPATTTHSTSPIDPRHMMSTVALPSPQQMTATKTATKRSSQHLRTDRLGSRSPNSIPSSPTSVHSSSSAIFERDIEPLTPPSPHSTNPHRIPRAKGTEQLEHAVPSVLDSAASILASIDNEEGVAVVSPLGYDGRHERYDVGKEREFGSPIGFDVFGRDFGSGFTSPIGSLGSRSPSPGRRTEGLLEALEGVSAHVVSSAGPSSGPGSPRSVKSSMSAAQSNQRVVHEVDEGPTPTSATFPESHPASPTVPATSASTAPSTSPPHQPTHTLQNRLSFISYADLLSSTPASLQPLSSLTTSASTSAEPPHLPAVSASLAPSALSPLSPTSSDAKGTSLSATSDAKFSSPGVSTRSICSRTGSRAPSVRGRDSILLVSDDVGGEWEREGLGRGLEERLEGALVSPLGTSKA